MPDLNTLFSILRHIISKKILLSKLLKCKQGCKCKQNCYPYFGIYRVLRKTPVIELLKKGILYQKGKYFPVKVINMWFTINFNTSKSMYHDKNVYWFDIHLPITSTFHYTLSKIIKRYMKKDEMYYFICSST